MLTTIFTIAFFSALFEVLIAQKVPTFRRWSGQNLIVNLVGSMLISYACGVAFGGSGTIMASAALISTIMTIPYYKAASWWYDQGGHQAYLRLKARWVSLLGDFAQLIHAVIRFLTIPVRVARYIRSVFA